MSLTSSRPGTSSGEIGAHGFDDLASALVASLLLLNYLFWLVTPHTPAPAIAIVAVAAAVIAYLGREVSQRRYLLAIAVTAGFFLLFFAPPTDWDARSVWFFHAKRMFFDGSIAARLDNYPGWAHTSYPDFVPAAAASIARLFGVWNEFLPKIALLLTLVPPVVVLLSRCESTYFKLFLLGSVLLLVRTKILSGSMDAHLALYAAAAVVLLREALGLRPGEERFASAIAALVMLFCVASIKNEGAAIALLLSPPLALLLYRRRRYASEVAAYVAIAVLASAPILIWKWQLRSADISALLVGDPWSRMAARINEGDAALVATALLAANAATLLVLIILGVLARRREWLVWYFAAGYLLVLFPVYLATPYDVAWHLGASATRIATVLKVLAVVLVVLELQRCVAPARR